MFRSKKPLGLVLDASLEDDSKMADTPLAGESKGDDDYRDSSESTYRDLGLSIGANYLRHLGDTYVHKQPSTGSATSAGGFTNVPSPPATPVIRKEDLSIVRTLGKGACSTVLLSRHNITGELFALKIFPLHDKQRRECLAKELSVLVKVDSEGLIQFHGGFYEPEGNEVWAVLEFMDRGSIGGLMEGGVRGGGGWNGGQESFRLPEAIVASIAYQMLWGVGYLHFENMLHRDIKPENVLFNSAGMVKLGDFGIASKRGEGVQMSNTVIGTTRYMSPERLRGRDYSTSSDLWSLGLVLLECVTETSPFVDVCSPIELIQTIDEMCEASDHNGEGGTVVRRQASEASEPFKHPQGQPLGIFELHALR